MNEQTPAFNLLKTGTLIDFDISNQDVQTALDEENIFMKVDLQFKAEEEFRHVLALEPNHIDAMQSLAWVKLSLNNLDPVSAGADVLRDVDRICDRALQIEP